MFKFFVKKSLEAIYCISYGVLSLITILIVLIRAFLIIHHLFIILNELNYNGLNYASLFLNSLEIIEQSESIFSEIKFLTWIFHLMDKLFENAQKYITNH